ncbi:MAM and LDL-receptor class A domain-containing protein 1-like [Amphiura filiformis]|uniref:MAM and LDL-receptor class A domain-containing protein 1-like n=1 Tax=Amphiura filiformis TaxID=82378 RepID=UPI003B214CEE
MGISYLGDVAIDDTLLEDLYCETLPVEADPDTYKDNCTCDFDGLLCLWEQDVNDDFDWTRNAGSAGPDWIRTGPGWDHTSQNDYGYYMYTESSPPRTPGEFSRLLSFQQPPTDPGGNCFEVWYHMYGSSMGILNIYWSDLQGNETLFWTNDIDRDDMWILARKTLTNITTNFQIIIEGIIGGDLSDMAIDDVLYTSGECADLRTCDFEYDMCDFIQEQSGADDLDWERSMGKDIATGPISDKTTQTTTGYLMYLKPAPPHAPGDKAVLYSGSYEPTLTGDCVKFWYYMSGFGAGTLAIWRSMGGKLEGPLWSKNGDQGALWRYGYISITANDDFRVAFEGTLGSTTADTIAIDDIDITEGPCDPPGYCDFNDGRCGWVNVDGDDFDWLRLRGHTPSGEFYPIYDHTTGTKFGFYMFVDIGNLIYGDVGWLNSEHLDPTTGSCFMFYYHMYGYGVGTLNVYKVDSSKTLLYTDSGNHGENWYGAQIDVISDTEYQIQIEVRQNFNYASDIAIDDTALVNGLCHKITTMPTRLPQTSTGKTLSTHPVNPTWPNVTRLPPVAGDDGLSATTQWDCDFEQNDTCNYIQAKDDKFDWTRNAGGTGSTDTGPSKDHTLGTDQGYYIYIEASSPRYKGDDARIESANVPFSYPTMCVDFWYHMYGDGIGTLNVYIKIAGQLGTLCGRELELGKIAGTEVSYEGVVGDSYLGDIALDDLSIYYGNCEGTQSCEFQDSTLCGYIQDATDDFEWTVLSGATPTNNTGPAVDVSYGTDYGKYIYTESTGQAVGDKARILAPSFIPDPGVPDVCWVFGYHMYGADTGSLSVKLNGQSTDLWSRTGNQGNKWFTGFVTVHNTTPYQLVFEATIGGDTSDIAIDDVNYRAGKCDPPGECDFEDDTCTWLQSEDDDFDWTRFTGSTPSLYTGPSRDHTTGSGRY